MTLAKHSTPLLHLEVMETREVLSGTNSVGLVGVVRDGRDWYLAGDSIGAIAAQIRPFGQTGDRYLSGDWNGEGKADLIAVRPNGEGGLTWRIDTDGDLNADVEHKYGLTGDVAFVGDWNGDRTLDVGVARKNHQSGGTDWYLDATRATYAGPAARQFGLVGDTPVVGDWNGDGRTDVGVTRPDATGLLQWNLDTSGDAWPEVVRNYGLLSTNDAPVTGDWNGDGKTDLGVTRNNAATGLKEWHLDTNGDTITDVTRAFGFARDTPVVGAWMSLAPVPTPPTVAVPAAAPAPRPLVVPPAAAPAPPDSLSRVSPAPIYPVYPNSAFSGDRNRTFVSVDVGGISNGRPFELSGVTVSIRKRDGTFLYRDARADDRGLVRFANLKVDERRAGLYQLVVAAPGYRTLVRDVPGYDSFPNVTFIDRDKAPGAVTPAAPPPVKPAQTFVFLFAGFATSSGTTGMHALAAAIGKDPAFAGADVQVVPGALSGEAMLATARAFLERHLREKGATASARVFIVGHSYGGEVARQVAADLRTHIGGAQPATALVTIDPVDYRAVTTAAQLDQRKQPKPAQAGVNPNSILNIVQRSPASSIFGYTLSAGLNDDEVAKGPDHRYGTRDDLVHTTVDDDPRVHAAVIQFLKRKL